MPSSGTEQLQDPQLVSQHRLGWGSLPKARKSHEDTGVLKHPLLSTPTASVNQCPSLETLMFAEWHKQLLCHPTLLHRGGPRTAPSTALTVGATPLARRQPCQGGPHSPRPSSIHPPSEHLLPLLQTALPSAGQAVGWGASRQQPGVC